MFTGASCGVILHPAEPSTGRVVQFADGTRVSATIDKLVGRDVHSTAVGENGNELYTVEHLLAALYLTDVDDCVIEVVRGKEIPCTRGGRASEFIDPVLSVGVRGQGVRSNSATVLVPSDFQWNGSKASLAPLSPGPDPVLRLAVEIDFEPPVGAAVVTWSSGEPIEPLVSARGFLRRATSYIWPDSGETHWDFSMGQLPGLPQSRADFPLMHYDDGEWTQGPAYPAEPAWHKAMDFIGDIALIGARIHGTVSVVRPGHAFNHKLSMWAAGIYETDPLPTARLD